MVIYFEVFYGDLGDYMIIYSNKVVTYEAIISANIVVEEGKIKAVIPDVIQMDADVDYGDKMIIPGIIDTHNHGGGGYRFDDADEEGVKQCLKTQASFGVTGMFPTTYVYEQYPTLVHLAKTFKEGTRILGIHSEGPWGARVGEKGVNLGYPKVDLKIADQMIQKADGYLRLVGVAPEIEDGLKAIEYFVKHGVTVAQYHTNATLQQSLMGIDHGVSVATHLFNVMTGLHHRDVGVAGASLLDPRVDCELICDGLHVSLPMIELALKMKDHDRVIMVSDNTPYLGAPVGKYKGSKINENTDRAFIHVTKEGFVLSDTGRLSGSSKPIIYGMANLVKKLGVDLVDVCRMASYNAARKYNLQGKGEIRQGNDADFVVIDDDFQVHATYIEGEKVYDAKIDKIPFSQKFLDEHFIGEE